jgi:hypothetical protein
MLQRNTSLDFIGLSRVSGYLLPLHFTCIYSGDALQQACGFSHEPQKADEAIQTGRIDIAFWIATSVPVRDRSVAPASSQGRCRRRQ